MSPQTGGASSGSRNGFINVLTDQVFKTSVLADSVLPLGMQDALRLLSETVGELGSLPP